MPTTSAAMDDRSTLAPTFPILPKGMQRSQVEALLAEVAPAIGLSGSRLQALLVMIGHTRPQAWTDPEDEPVCYASQVELAAALGKTERAVRADEAALSRRLGLIEKRTAANGSRSRSGGLGLVFSRLIALVPELLALRERRRVERARVQTLVRLRSSYFRHLRDGLAELHPRHPADPELGAIRDAVLAWPASGALRSLGLEALEDHVACARALCDALDAWARGAEGSDERSIESSGRAAESFRSHLQDTTKEPLDTCNQEQMERPAETERQDLFVSRLGPRRLYELAGADMRLCLDMAGRSPERLRELDFVTAAIHLLPALGISGPAWRDAVDAMGDLRAAICVLITDANRDHPVTPVRKPGGHLRALTQRHRSGQLNIVGSLIGLAERRGAQ
jgi:replication initiation protein RepC